MKKSRKLFKLGIAALFLSPASGASAQSAPDSQMVRVPAGQFTMGCQPLIDPVCSFAPDEKQHQVYLPAYRIDKYEVTFRRYQKCIDAGKCTPPAVGGALNYGWPGVDKFPVNGVTWYQARDFCKWQGRRLPTEAEWEKAARGTDMRIYPWGNGKPNCNRAVVDKPNAGYLGCNTGNTMNVGSKPAGKSPYGAHDMAGNVWEWVNDWHDETYYNRSPYWNPKGPNWGLYKVTRGGDLFTRNGYEARSTSRFPYEPTDYSIAVGFRCAK